VRSDLAVRLVRRPLDWVLGPEDVLRLLRSDAHPVALLGAWAGGNDIIASDPVQVRCPSQSLGDVLDAPWPMRSWPAGRMGPGDEIAAGHPGRPFGGGWIGYLGFGLAGEFLAAPPAPGEPRRLPAWWFGYYDHVLRRDRATGRWVFEALWTPGRADALERRFEDLSRRPQAARPQPPAYYCAGFRLVPSAEEHRSAVGRTIGYIRRGDIFQANICLRLEAGFSGDPLDAFCRAAARLHPPYAAFARISPGSAVASLSPELFLRRTGTSVITRPIKGTRRRPADDEDAARQREVLLRSAKDRAENVMIVDLMRNDLSRVCAAGSVEVPRLLRAEAHPGVWHLVSDVHGTLPASNSDGRLVAATFPPGSVTGAPKVRAVEIIHELEATPREVYTGAIGYRSPLAGLELNVAIRTFEFHDGRVWLGSGGGITARSTEAGEYRESLLKATPLIAALDASISGRPGTPAASSCGPALVSPSLRPRPAAGVFTSLRVTGGRVHNLGRHLARLENSTQQLFGKHLPPALREQLAAALGELPSGRLRITARPVGGPLRVTAEVVPASPPPDMVTLRPVIIAGGLGAHKWQDRRLLADLATAVGAGSDEHLLIQDHDGGILETDRASIFAMIDGVLHTPPADGRLLPGITRVAVLDLAEREGITTRTAPMTRQQLAQASEVFVTNSLHGVIPVRAVTGSAESWAAGPAATRIAALLADRPTASGCPAQGTAARRSGQASAALISGRANGPIVVLVDNYDSFTYNLAHLLLVSGCEVEVVRNDEVAAEDIAAFRPAGIVISPGPCAPADAGISVDTVRRCGPAIPLLGICLGHQAIAAAHGAQIIPAPRPVHGQASPISHDGRGVLHGLPQRFEAARYHSLLVEEDTLPASLAVTARTSEGLLMGIRHTRHPSEGVQFHPESVLTTHGDAIIRTFTRAIRGRRERSPSSAG
jgi:para-aminobenzoate synthetase/4-amino-4-deoxychorismate lyase